MNFPLRIIIFPIFYFTMAGLVWYEIWRGFGSFWANLWAVFSVGTIAWAMVVRFVEFETPVWLALVGYMYLPFTGLMFLSLLIFEILDFVSGRAITRNFPLQRVLICITALVIFLLIYGYFEAARVRINEITVPTDKLPHNIELVRIVQLSDLHIGKVFDEKRLESVMKLAAVTSADMVVITGDIVDADLRGRDDLKKILGDVHPPLGKFAVTGNHEHYAGFDQAVEFIKGAGYELLQSRWVDTGAIVVAGVDDEWRVVSSKDPSVKLLTALSEDVKAREKFVLFLKHQPSIDEGTIGLFDLQLSGHTHGGQIYPFRLVTYLTHGYSQGMSQFSGANGNSLLYVSNGTGFWGPPVRIFSPPEITVFNVVRKK